MWLVEVVSCPASTHSIWSLQPCCMQGRSGEETGRRKEINSEGAWQKRRGTRGRGLASAPAAEPCHTVWIEIALQVGAWQARS